MVEIQIFGFVETLKESTVQKRNVGKESQYLLFFLLEHFLVAVKVPCITSRLGGSKTARIALLIDNGTVERGKKEVLQDGIIVVAINVRCFIKVNKNGL